MKKIGIVGGIGWQSTMEYYSELCRRSEHWHLARNPRAVPPIPEISIESLDLAKAIAYLGSDDDEQSWSRFDDYHRHALKRLETNGADFALMASNTPHHRFEAIVRSVRIPVISILDEMAKESARIGAQQVLLLGTALTMTSTKFRQTFAKHGIEATSPLEGIRWTLVDKFRRLLLVNSILPLILCVIGPLLPPITPALTRG
jgi:aspartate racemase